MSIMSNSAQSAWSLSAINYQTNPRCPFLSRNSNLFQVIKWSIWYLLCRRV